MVVRTLLALLISCGAKPLYAGAEVSAADQAGFHLRIVSEIHATPEAVYSAIVDEVGQWWDPAHTYSADAANLSMDLEKGCFMEKLPDGGFVRHLEIVYHQPGRTLRLTGGLGPLQGMGLHGALTIQLTPGADGTRMEWTYNVSGYAPGGLKSLAAVVDRVLSGQVGRLRRFCETVPAAPAASTPHQ